MKFEKYYQELLELNVGTILKDEPLYKHTTYRVGGPARLFIKVKDVEGQNKQLTMELWTNSVELERFCS